MRTLIVKLGAAGDVVRTTTLLNILDGEIHWLTNDLNTIFLDTNPKIQKCISWSDALSLKDSEYDLVINLEDSPDAARLLNEIKYGELYGAYIGKSGILRYTKNSNKWFDLSIISRFGKERADKLKFRNRKTYQELLFEGLGHTFRGEKYFLPAPGKTDLQGDIAIAPKSGNVWPMKNWAYYQQLKRELEQSGFAVNFLPIRNTVLEHIADVRNHRYLISGDTLPMHLALGSGIRCLTIFICTSPWEIHDYGLQEKLTSPLLEEFFYKRDFNVKATKSISLDEVHNVVLDAMKSAEIPNDVFQAKGHHNLPHNSRI
jgi:heptosyltransferase-2